MAVHRCRRCAGYPALATGRAAVQPLVGSAAPRRQCTAVQSSRLPRILAELAMLLYRQHNRTAYEGSVQFCSALYVLCIVGVYSPTLVRTAFYGNFRISGHTIAPDANLHY